MDERRRHAKLLTEYRVLQAVGGKDRNGQARRGVWLTLPLGLCQAMDWRPGDIVEVKRAGRHLELHRREVDGGDRGEAPGPT